VLTYYLYYRGSDVLRSACVNVLQITHHLIQLLGPEKRLEFGLVLNGAPAVGRTRSAQDLTGPD
jgi:hypothetical protein